MSMRAISASAPAESESGVKAAAAEVPLSFEPNAGRAPRGVDFIAHSVGGGTLQLSASGAVLSSPRGKHHTRAVGLELQGSDPSAEAMGVEQLPGKANVFLGDDPSKWRSGLPTYGRVRYEGIYRGVDVDYYGNQRRLEYDFRLAPNVDPNEISIELRGADSARIGADGDLVVAAGKGSLRQAAPIAYQEISGERRNVQAAYELDGRRVGFRLGAYDPSRPLVIDPLVLAYSTYLGGSDVDAGNDIAVDSAGAAYVTGTTGSTNFPTQDPFQGPQAPDDVFITKLNPDSGGAVTLAYSTYLGGNAADVGKGIAVDSLGAAYVTGLTRRNGPMVTSTFPTVDPSLDFFEGGDLQNVFVTKLNPDFGGVVTLGYSTFLLGGLDDEGSDIAVDAAGAAYVTGETESSGTDCATSCPFGPPIDAFQGTYGGGAGDAFATKLNPEPPDAPTEPSTADDVSLGYSTYLGGGGNDLGLGVAVHSNGAAYVTGQTASGGMTSFPTQDPLPLQGTNQGGIDAFVTNVNPEPADVNPDTTADDATLAYSTYLGGGVTDSGDDIAVDPSGAAYLTGFSASSGPTSFPTQDPFQGVNQGAEDAFATKLNPDSGGAVSLAYSTYLGGGGSDLGNDIAVDSTGAAYVTGATDSTNFPPQDPFQPNQPGTDAFVAKLAPDSGATSQTLAYSTYLGGGAADSGAGIAVDSTGAAYVTGSTDSAGFPVQDPFQPNQPSTDAFVTRLTLAPAAVPAPVAAAAAPGSCKGRTATITGTAAGDRISATNGADVIAAADGDDTVFGLGGKDVICGEDGDDKLVGGSGKDILLGQADNDTLKGGGAKDVLKGGGAKDKCIGGPANDTARACETRRSI